MRNILQTLKTEDGTQEIGVLDYLKTDFIGRSISFKGLEDGSISIVINNDPESTRAKEVIYRMTPESLVCLMSIANIYFDAKGIDSVELLETVMPEDMIYEYDGDEFNLDKYHEKNDR